MQWDCLELHNQPAEPVHSQPVQPTATQSQPAEPGHGQPLQPTATHRQLLQPTQDDEEGGPMSDERSKPTSTSTQGSTPQKKAAECNYCGKVYSNQSNLCRHERVHVGGVFDCGECKRIFFYLTCSQRPYQYQPFRFSIPMYHSGKTFKQKRYLQEHVKSHKNPDRYLCQTCGIVMKSRSTLLMHKKRNHPKM